MTVVYHGDRAAHVLPDNRMKNYIHVSNLQKVLQIFSIENTKILKYKVNSFFKSIL
jgi:hypothetical protein